MSELYEVILGRKLTNTNDKIKYNRGIIKTDKTKYKLNLYKVDDKLINNYTDEDFKKIMQSVAFQSYFNQNQKEFIHPPENDNIMESDYKQINNDNEIEKSFQSIVEEKINLLIKEDDKKNDSDEDQEDEQMVDNSQNNINELIEKDRELYKEKKMTKKIIIEEIIKYDKNLINLSNKNKSELIDILINYKYKYPPLD